MSKKTSDQDKPMKTNFMRQRQSMADMKTAEYNAPRGRRKDEDRLTNTEIERQRWQGESLSNLVNEMQNMACSVKM